MPLLYIDPWSLVATNYHVGQDVRVKIVKVANFGAFAELEDGVEGLIHLSELSSERIGEPEEVVSVGQELDARVIKIDAEARKIGLSIRAFSEESAQSELDEVNRQASDTVTLGDMIPDEISDLRSALADAEKQTESTDEDDDEPVR